MSNTVVWGGYDDGPVPYLALRIGAQMLVSGTDQNLHEEVIATRERHLAVKPHGARPRARFFGFVSSGGTIMPVPEDLWPHIGFYVEGLTFRVS